jgi:hypothetical protein
MQMKVKWSGCINPLISVLRTVCSSAMNFRQWLPYDQGKWLIYPMNRCLGGPHCLDGHFGEETKLIALLRIELLSSVVQTGHYELLESLICTAT